MENLKPAEDDIVQPPSANTSIEFQTVPEGTCVFERGDTRDFAYLIEKGRVQIQDEGTTRSKEPLTVLGKGEIFGEMALIEAGTRTASAVALEETHMLKIPPEILYERITGLDPLVGLLLSMLVDRYRRARISNSEFWSKDIVTEPAIVKDDNTAGQLASSMASVLRSKEETLQELKLEQDLRIALDEKYFKPFLQPIINLNDRVIKGFEALVRWEHPEKGMIFPDQFIPVAERMGFIQSIDMLMLEYAIGASAEINRRVGDPDGDIYVAVNLSGFNFQSNDTVEKITNLMANNCTNPQQVRLEITESAFVGEHSVAESMLSSLKSLGFKIALDDFGTGYSSLNYLHKFSIDTLKIDRVFVTEMNSSAKGLDIIRAIIGLAQTFQLGLVAEGIEREEEIMILQALGCEDGQGYHLGKPMPLDKAYDFAVDSVRK